MSATFDPPPPTAKDQARDLAHDLAVCTGDRAEWWSPIFAGWAAALRLLGAARADLVALRAVSQEILDHLDRPPELLDPDRTVELCARLFTLLAAAAAGPVAVAPAAGAAGDNAGR